MIRMIIFLFAFHCLFAICKCCKETPVSFFLFFVLDECGEWSWKMGLYPLAFAEFMFVIRMLFL